MWRTTEQKVDLIFSKEAKIPDGKYRVPGLIWVFGESLDLYAYQEWENEKTKLYLPPFYNCTGPDVCLGTAADYLGRDTNRVTFAQVTRDVEAAFWNSRFTHAGGGKNINGNFGALYEKTLNASSYPYEYLIPANKKTLKDISDEIFSP